MGVAAVSLPPTMELRPTFPLRSRADCRLAVLDVEGVGTICNSRGGLCYRGRITVVSLRDVANNHCTIKRHPCVELSEFFREVGQSARTGCSVQRAVSSIVGPMASATGFPLMAWLDSDMHGSASLISPRAV